MQTTRTITITFSPLIESDLEHISHWKEDWEWFEKYIVDNPNPKRSLYAAKHNGYAIGHVAITVIDDSTIDIGTLELFEPYRWMGIWTELTQYCEKLYKEQWFSSSRIGAYIDEYDNQTRYVWRWYSPTDKTEWCDAAEKEFRWYVKEL